MSKRNMVWLAIVVVVGVVLGVAVGIGWGFLAAGIVLVISEVVERTRRARRRSGNADASGSSVRDVIDSRRKTR